MGMKEFESRMRDYEINNLLPKNMPIIIRIDGRTFRRFTSGMDKPFDEKFIEMMNNIAIKLCKEIQHCRMAYIQSDEISFLVYQKNIDTDGWFSNKIEKMCSVISSKASSIATKYIMEYMPERLKYTISFDARVNVYPVKEVANYFIWRQKDWERNSLFMIASSYYSPKELMYKKKNDQHNMIHNAGDNWDRYPVYLKRGRCCVKIKTLEYIENDHFQGEVEKSRWIINNIIPEFTKDRNYILSKLAVDFDEVSHSGIDVKEEISDDSNVA